MTGPGRASDRELDGHLEAVAGGDREAFRLLYAIAAPRIFAICLRLMRTRDAAQDVAQDAFLRIWQKAYLFDRSKGDAMTWMAILARRCALDRLASSSAKLMNGEELDESLARIDDTVDVTDRLGLERCLSQLDEASRRPVMLAFLYGMQYEEIAAREGIPVGTVKSRVFRALCQLKECMG